jgi:N-acetylglucosaminyldiphosphoundecaprenol N-acetyl-beta-D-mannosaminyltransferase
MFAPRSGGGGAFSVASLSILGVRVDDVTYDESIALIARWIDEARAGHGSPHVVTTPNPEFVMAARRDPSFRALLGQTALNVPDGIGLMMAARLRRQRFREHVRGSDLVSRLAAAGAAHGHRWYLLGAGEGIAQRAAAAVQQRFPGLTIVGAAPGSPRPEDDAATWAMIRAAGPVDLILVAYGAPNQERWLSRSLGPLGIPVGIGVGGVFNFLSGAIPRAPRWMQRLELEWLHRLIVQPSRWRRQARLPAFMLLAALEALRDGPAPSLSQRR